METCHKQETLAKNEPSHHSPYHSTSLNLHLVSCKSQPLSSNRWRPEVVTRQPQRRARHHMIETNYYEYKFRSFLLNRSFKCISDHLQALYPTERSPSIPKHVRLSLVTLAASAKEMPNSQKPFASKCNVFSWTFSQLKTIPID